MDILINLFLQKHSSFWVRNGHFGLEKEIDQWLNAEISRVLGRVV